MASEEWLSISKEQFKKLMDSDLMLDCLEQAGVDNWDGYAEAQEEYNRRKANE